MPLSVVGKPAKPDPNTPVPSCGVVCDYGIVAHGHCPLPTPQPATPAR